MQERAKFEFLRHLPPNMQPAVVNEMINVRDKEDPLEASVSRGNRAVLVWLGVIDDRGGGTLLEE